MAPIAAILLGAGIGYFIWCAIAAGANMKDED